MLRQPMPSMPKPIKLSTMTRSRQQQAAGDGSRSGGATLQARENDFFHELYQSPNLNASHPLKHLAMVDDVRRRATRGNEPNIPACGLLPGTKSAQMLQQPPPSTLAHSEMRQVPVSEKRGETTMHVHVCTRM